MGRRHTRDLHFLDRLPASNQRIRSCQIQIIRYARRSGTRADNVSIRLYRQNAKSKSGGSKPSSDTLPSCVIDNSLAVDAACSGNPGPMEYRGVHIASRQEIFISAR